MSLSRKSQPQPELAQVFGTKSEIDSIWMSRQLPNKTERPGMTKFRNVGPSLLAYFLVIGGTTAASSQDTATQPVRLLQTISMPGVKGRLDHMDVDSQGKRLFVAGLENGTLEIVDLQAGKR